MGLTSSLFAGLTGMKTNEFRMDIIGNNIANVNTYGYKSSRASFQTQFSHTLSFGSAPNGEIGGGNPVQVGTGTQVGGVTRDFSGGAPETTGNKTDLAVQGKGMFILQKPDGGHVYSRDGSFQFNSENYLLSADGFFLQGYGVDSNFNIVEGTLTKLRIPVGEITTAASTNNAKFSGDLNANGTAGLDENGDANGNIRGILQTTEITDAGGVLTGGSLLVNLENADTNALLLEGNIITLSDAIKGGKTLSATSFQVEATSTLQEYMDWLEGVLGINDSADLVDLDLDLDGDLTTDNYLPGVKISEGGEGIDIVSNMGSFNIIDMQANKALSVTQGDGTGLAAAGGLPFTFVAPDGYEVADIESVRTSFRAYDSLGIPLNVDVTIVMESKEENGGIVWRYFAECAEDVRTDEVNRSVGTGTITFDGNGNFLEASDMVITIDRQNTGASSPQSITLDFSTMDGFAITDSSISLYSQDGFQSGTLQDFSVSSDGIITGSFTNGLTRNLGQVVLANFRNYEGLVAGADNIYMTGPNSGDPIIKKPQELGAGTVNSAALELSNVDLSREFINLIISSTGFSASSRVIQTSDRLLSELMSMTR